MAEIGIMNLINQSINQKQSQMLATASRKSENGAAAVCNSSSPLEALGSGWSLIKDPIPPGASMGTMRIREPNPKSHNNLMGKEANQSCSVPKFPSQISVPSRTPWQEPYLCKYWPLNSRVHIFAGEKTKQELAGEWHQTIHLCDAHLA